MDLFKRKIETPAESVRKLRKMLATAKVDLDDLDETASLLRITFDILRDGMSAADFKVAIAVFSAVGPDVFDPAAVRAVVNRPEVSDADLVAAGRIMRRVLASGG